MLAPILFQSDAAERVPGRMSLEDEVVKGDDDAGACA